MLISVLFLNCFCARIIFLYQRFCSPAHHWRNPQNSVSLYTRCKNNGLLFFYYKKKCSAYTFSIPDRFYLIFWSKKKESSFCVIVPWRKKWFCSSFGHCVWLYRQYIVYYCTSFSGKYIGVDLQYLHYGNAIHCITL